MQLIHHLVHISLSGIGLAQLKLQGLCQPQELLVKPYLQLQIIIIICVKLLILLQKRLGLFELLSRFSTIFCKDLLDLLLGIMWVVAAGGFMASSDVGQDRLHWSLHGCSNFSIFGLM